MIRIVGGARLATGGIHLGHYVGNFLSMLDFDSPKQYIFVIKDTEPVLWPSNEVKGNTLLDMISDVLSLPFSDSILVTTSSRILSSCYSINSIILDIVSFNALVTAHFKKKDLRDQAAVTSVKNFLFPIDEATTLLALRAGYFASNDDNLRIVRFSRDIARKFNAVVHTEFFPLPELKHHKLVPRLAGADYRRMCKAHKNTIRISEDPQVLYERIRQLISWKTYFSINSVALEAYRVDGSKFIFPQDYLPFLYWRIFSDSELTPEDMALYSKVENREKLCQELFERMDDRLQSIRVKKAHLLERQSTVWKRLEEDSEVVRQNIDSTLKDLKGIISLR